MFFLKIYLFISILPAFMPPGQKKAPGLIIDDYESPYGCWKLNVELLEKQSALLTAEQTLQPPVINMLEGVTSRWNTTIV